MTLCFAIREGFSYSRRAGARRTPAHPRVPPRTCRDFALLMMEAVRALGLAARFVTGYVQAVTVGQPRRRLDTRRAALLAGRRLGRVRPVSWATATSSGLVWRAIPVRQRPLTGSYSGTRIDYTDVTTEATADARLVQ